MHWVSTNVEKESVADQFAFKGQKRIDGLKN